MVLVAERTGPEADGGREVLGVGRLSKIRNTGDAEFAMLISNRSGAGAWARRCWGG